jgi:hypothetical protein
LKGLVLAAYAGALLAAVSLRALRQSQPVRLLLVLLIVFYGTQSVFNAKYLVYFVHIVPIYSALLGYVIWYFWTRAPRSRPLLILAVGGLAILQLGFIIGKARTLSRVNELRDLRIFLANHCENSRLIFADGALLHTLGYDSRFLDDRYFGVRSGKRADVIIQVPYLDENLYGTLRQVRPGDWVKIQQRLAEYRPVFESPGYRVLFDSVVASPLAKDNISQK